MKESEWDLGRAFIHPNATTYYSTFMGGMAAAIAESQNIAKERNITAYTYEDFCIEVNKGRVFITTTRSNK